MKSITLYLEDEDYEALSKHILQRKLTGEQLTFNQLLRSQLKSYIDSLKNGNKPPKKENKDSVEESEQRKQDKQGVVEDIKQEGEQSGKFNFDDVDL